MQGDNTIKFDNYNGSWGKIQELEKLQDKYNQGVVAQQLEAQGFLFAEEVEEEDGEITWIYTSYD